MDGRRKEFVDDKGKSGRGRKVLAGVAVLVVAAVAAAVYWGGSGTTFEAVTAEAGMVKIPAAVVEDGKAHFYTYSGGGTKINFFVLKSSDGVVRAAFDACDVCYRSKKGYRQEGSTMVCNNCGQRFTSAMINEVKGGCNPAPLERTSQGDYIIMRASDIEDGRVYF